MVHVPGSRDAKANSIVRLCYWGRLSSTYPYFKATGNVVTFYANVGRKGMVRV